MRPEKLYLVTRRDLPLGQQAIQACHALREFTAQHPEVDLQWYLTSNHLALLEVPDETALSLLAEKANREGIKFSLFREPDRGDELTAVAFEPGAKRMLRGLRLALSE